MLRNVSSRRLGLLGWSLVLGASAIAACPAQYTPLYCYDTRRCPWVTDPATCTCTSCGWEFFEVAEGKPGKRAHHSVLYTISCVRNVCNYQNGVAICDGSTPYHSTYLSQQTLVDETTDCTGGVPW